MYHTTTLKKPESTHSSPLDNIKLHIDRWRYSVYPYGELSCNNERTRFWFQPWGMKEIQINEESFYRWFAVMFPNGLSKVQTRTANFGDSDKVRGRFLE